MFTINNRDKTPIYEQLENSIVDYILLGLLKDGEQLPTVRALAQEMNINPNTVQKVYSSLESKGVISTVIGKGAFVSDKITVLSVAKSRSQQALHQEAVRGKNNGLTLEEQIEIVKKVYLEADK